MSTVARNNVPPLSPVPMTRDRVRLFSSLATLVVAVGGTMILFSYDPARYGFYPPCFLRAITGLNCPGCGSLRAIHQLLHGHVLEAARLNLLLVVSLPGCAWWGVRCGWLWLSGKAVMFEVRPAWLWVLFAIASVFTFLRNLPAFEWLAP